MVLQAGFSTVDVLAGLAGHDGHQGVPVVGRGDIDRVHVLVFEQPPEIPIGFGPASDARGRVVQVFRVHVAQRHRERRASQPLAVAALSRRGRKRLAEFGFGPQVRPPAPADSDMAQPQRVARSRLPLAQHSPRHDVEQKCSAGRGRRLQKVPSPHGCFLSQMVRSNSRVCRTQTSRSSHCCLPGSFPGGTGIAGVGFPRSASAKKRLNSQAGILR